MTRGVHDRLTRAIIAHAGDSATIAAASSEPWASATFRGARHRLAVSLHGSDAAERASVLARSIADVEFRLPGHLVADIAVTARHDAGDGATVEIEALTVEDG